MQERNGGEARADESVASSKGAWREAVGGVMERTGDVVQDAGRGARRLADDASRTVRQASRQAADAYGRTAESAERAYRRARAYALDHPGATVAVTLAAGVGLGVLLVPRHRPRSSRAYLGIVPVFAIALAQAALNVFDLSVRRAGLR